MVCQLRDKIHSWQYLALIKKGSTSSIVEFKVDLGIENSTVYLKLGMMKAFSYAPAFGAVYLMTVILALQSQKTQVKNKTGIWSIDIIPCLGTPEVNFLFTVKPLTNQGRMVVPDNISLSGSSESGGLSVLDEVVDYLATRTFKHSGDEIIFTDPGKENFMEIPSGNSHENGSVVVAAMYKNLTEFFISDNNINGTNKTRKLNTIIMSAEIYPELDKLQENITLVFKNMKKASGDRRECVFWKMFGEGDRHAPLSHIRVGLTSCIGAGHIVFLAGVDATGNKAVCLAVAALMQYSLMAAFCWMLVEGIYIYLFVVKVYNISDKLRRYHVLCWGLPAVIVAASLGIVARKDGIENFVNDQ
ncbi:Latrophilin-like protein LAT-2, partial [Stylophora pistillata]